MAPVLSCTDKLALGSHKLLELSHQLFRMCQSLPSISMDYKELAELDLFLPICLENLHKLLTLHNVCDEPVDAKYGQLLADIDKLGDFASELYDVVDQGLPYSCEGVVSFDEPRHVHCVVSEMRAIESTANVFLAILELGFLGPAKEE